MMQSTHKDNPGARGIARASQPAHVDHAGGIARDSPTTWTMPEALNETVRPHGLCWNWRAGHGTVFVGYMRVGQRQNGVCVAAILWGNPQMEAQRQGKERIGKDLVDITQQSWIPFATCTY